MSQLDIARPPGPADEIGPNGPHGRIPPGQGPAPDDASLARWMWTWITIGVLVLIVVIGFLLAISSTLETIDANLAEANDAVTGVGQDVEPLPGRLQQVNESLAAVDEQLAAVPGQADEVIGALGSILGTLGDVDSSLRDTSASLEDTSGSLVDTSGSLDNTSSVLEDVLSLARQIEATLESAESPPDDLGARDIFMRVARANGFLDPARQDTTNILGQLAGVNAHLESICRALPPEDGRCRAEEAGDAPSAASGFNRAAAAIVEDRHRVRQGFGEHLSRVVRDTVDIVHNAAADASSDGTCEPTRARTSATGCGASAAR